MIRVAIIDDENLVRLGIRSSIDWEAFGYSIIGEAADGQSGLKLIRTEEPDLVFLDIAMPNMDGISLLKALKVQNRPCQVVVLSCHDDFEYVRQSMQYGASRYILKNEIDAVTIRELLEDIRGELLQSQGNTARRNRWPDEMADACRRILSGKAVAQEERARLYGRYARMVCAWFSVRNYRAVLKRYEENQEMAFTSKVMGFCSEWTQMVAPYAVKVYNCDANRYLLMFLCGPDEPCDLDEIVRMMRTLQNVLNGYLNLDIYAGLSGVRHLPEDLEKGVVEAEMARAMCFFRPRTLRVCKNVADILRNEQVHARMHELYDESLNRNYRQVRVLVGRLFELCGEIAEAEVFDVRDVQNCVLNMLRLAGIKEYGAGDEGLFDVEDGQAFLQAVNQVLQRAIAKEDALSGRHNALTAEAVDYIALHYADNISLQTIARALHVSKSHLCRVFSREMKVPLHEYLNGYRVERAKELIRNSDMRMCDVALRSGFQNTTHFNVTFKRIVLQTPVEYRSAKRK